jgi:Rho termination factor, N-terminal domain
MDNKTLKELRALAKAKGLKGYSKLTKDELLGLLTGKRAQAAPEKKPVPAAKKAGARKAARPAAAAPLPAQTDTAVPAIEDRIGSEEERIEHAKFAVVPRGVGYAEPRFVPDLNEDIDNLPIIAEPMLALLPQKPGVLHAYWRLPTEAMTAGRTLKLRLGCLVGDMFQIIEEVGVPQASGHWYFHIDDSVDYGAIYLQLGFYEADGRFITAFNRAIARIPSLYASRRTDRYWWISDEQFRAMYLRAGGYLAGVRLGWAASISSPGAPPGAPGPEEQQLVSMGGGGASGLSSQR